MRLVLTALGLSLLMGDIGLREDELDCEKAVSYLQQCCPDFAAGATLQCEYSDGCGVIEPAISIADSQCILGRSCAEIVAGGICERAKNLSSPQSSSSSDGGPVPNQVCQ